MKVQIIKKMSIKIDGNYLDFNAGISDVDEPIGKRLIDGGYAKSVKIEEKQVTGETCSTVETQGNCQQGNGNEPLPKPKKAEKPAKSGKIKTLQELMGDK